MNHRVCVIECTVWTRHACTDLLSSRGMNAVRSGWRPLLLLLAQAFGCASEFGGTAEEFHMTAAASGEAYLVQVFLPREYDDAAAHLPVAVVLDGPSASLPVAEFAEEDGHPPLVVVGVGYPEGFAPNRRLVDDTPTAVAEQPSGEATRFFGFLRDEVIPEIAHRYRVEAGPHVLMGHSLGGLFALHVALTQDPDAPVFDRIAAASPSLWWDGGVMFGVEEAFAATHDDLPIELFLGAGTLESALILGYQREMEQRLRARGYPGLRVSAREYRWIHHSAAWRPAYRDALRFFFPE